jgi:hypothetical protein
MEGTAWSTVHGVPQRVRIHYPGTAPTPNRVWGAQLPLAALIFALGGVVAAAHGPGDDGAGWWYAFLLPLLALALVACLFLTVDLVVAMVHRSRHRRVIDRWLRTGPPTGRPGQASVLDRGGRRPQDPVSAFRFDGASSTGLWSDPDFRLRVSHCSGFAHSLEIRIEPLVPSPGTGRTRAPRARTIPGNWVDQEDATCRVGFPGPR